MRLPSLKVLILGTLLFIGIICIFFEQKSPAYLYINDTPNHIAGYIFGDTSPGVPIELKPGTLVFIDME